MYILHIFDICSIFFLSTFTYFQSGYLQFCYKKRSLWFHTRTSFFLFCIFRKRLCIQPTPTSHFFRHVPHEHLLNQMSKHAKHPDLFFRHIFRTGKFIYRLLIKIMSFCKVSSHFSKLFQLLFPTFLIHQTKAKHITFDQRSSIRTAKLCRK